MAFPRRGGAPCRPRVAAELWDGCDAAVASRLAYPEVRAALAAAPNHDLDEHELDAAERAWDGYWAATAWLIMAICCRRHSRGRQARGGQASCSRRDGAAQAGVRRCGMPRARSAPV